MRCPSFRSKSIYIRIMLLVTTSPLQMIFLQRADIKESGISAILGWRKIGTMCSLPSFALHHESLLCTSRIRFIHSQSNHSNMFSTKLNDDKESDKGNWGIKIICSDMGKEFWKKKEKGNVGIFLSTSFYVVFPTCNGLFNNLPSSKEYHS